MLLWEKEDDGRQAGISESIQFKKVSYRYPQSERYAVSNIDMIAYCRKKSTLPNGIHTLLGQLDDGGVWLSKGQWQRLAIARLMANDDAKVWILDEPTASLDPLSEIELYNLIMNVAQDKMVFFISHRLGFAKQVNRILLFCDGKIIGDSTHHSLMKEEHYKEMFESQESWYV